MCGLGDVIWQAESDPHARAVLARHWPSVRCYEDVREIDATSPRPDIICGGFPCQDVSNAGPRLGLRGERSGLWFEFARIIRDLRPSIVFVENVAALVDRGIDVVLGDLAAAGFDAEWGCFGACEAGRPHTRERLFILAYTNALSGSTWFRARETWQWQVSGSPDPKMPADVRMESDRELLRMADGFPREVDRLAGLGNACCPQQAALAFRTLVTRASPPSTDGPVRP
jgi:DNA (cytosine-5)-methyltransferase 1